MMEDSNPQSSATARDITFTVDASLNFKEKRISRRPFKPSGGQLDKDSMEGWAVLFDSPEKDVRQTRCSHEGQYSGDMEGWAQHNYIMTHWNDDGGKRSTWMGQALFSGSILGRKGAVGIALWGDCTKDRLTQHWKFYPETATGDLAGISGGGTFEGSTEQGQPVTLRVQFD